MNRYTFLGLLGTAATTPLRRALAVLSPNLRLMQPEQFLFHDDGQIPNSRFPVLLYRNAFPARDMEGAAWLEKRFAANNWTNSWRNGVYAYHHYHSTSHEVLGVYAGTALLQLGGEQGQQVRVQAGDILVLPAGVGHKNLGSEQLGIVGAYPEGRHWDVNRGLPGERPQADQNIAALPIPTTDPLLGSTQGLPTLWKK
ncbi:cupin domain-containing protein [Hymenobacter defluvii]|uniref:cupin domain-containing protein n=1 Tax=Hymenobacter defluvii TaxID=2054411 RepID=UPI001FB9717F|nr:cupin domain-containing protein [Hymenobacter defluvii]